MLRKVVLFVVLAAAAFPAVAQSLSDGVPDSVPAVKTKRRAFLFEASYVGDGYYNMAGGLKTGGGFMGMANIKVGFDTEAARWWKGGAFFVNGASIHGKSLTDNYLGDMQVASNIDAGEHTYLHELWFGQRFDFRKPGARIAFKLGLQDLNAEFLTSEGACEFINSSFGVPPVIATGIPVPIFPITGLGVSLRVDFDENWTLQTAVFDGNQTTFERNPHNVHWQFSKADGVLAVGEAHFRGRYKLGGYYHSADKNYGFYAFADQPVARFLSLFGQVAFAPKSKNFNNYSLALGTNWTLHPKHTMGLAATYAGLHGAGHKHETALEFFYKFTLNDNIAIQPDFQYIVNPSGGETKLPNAFVGMLRVSINFATR